MRRGIIAAAAVVGVVLTLLMIFSLSYGQSLRRSRVLIGRSVLEQAQKQLAETGRVEANGSWRPFAFTNDVVIDNRVHHCSVATPLPGFVDEGVFAITTNQIFIWVGTKGSPKIIPTSEYRPRFFPESF